MHFDGHGELHFLHLGWVPVLHLRHYLHHCERLLLRDWEYSDWEAVSLGITASIRVWVDFHDDLVRDSDELAFLRRLNLSSEFWNKSLLFTICTL